MNNPLSVLFGVPIDNCTMDETIERLGELVRLGHKHEKTHQVATVNVDFLVNALGDAHLMRLLQSADLNLADGMPIVWASRLLGTPVTERVAGSDLVARLAGASEERGWRIHLFGAAPGVASRARSMMLEMNPGASVTADSGPLSIDADTFDHAIAASIAEVEPDVLCVALGNPKQERFIASYRDVLQCPVMIGIGGSLDMLVGDKKRAPQWAQRFGAEWLFRAAQEPGRLGRRYAHDFRVFGPEVFRYRRALSKYRTLPSEGVESGARKILLAATTQVPSIQQVAGSNAPLTLDLDGVDGLSPTAHAHIVSVLREARLHEIPVAADGISTALRACFEDYRTLSLLTPEDSTCSDRPSPS